MTRMNRRAGNHAAAALPDVIIPGMLARVPGPDRPQPATVTTADEGGLRVTVLPTRILAAAHPDTWWWVGCHGGAGVSTLQAVTGKGHDALRTWPVRPDGLTSAVLVARTHEHGLRMAQAVTRQWASGELAELIGREVSGQCQVRLLGRVLVPDSKGALPGPLQAMARLIAGGAPRAWQLKWHEAFRFGVDTGTMPADYRELVKDVSGLIQQGASRA